MARAVPGETLGTRRLREPATTLTNAGLAIAGAVFAALVFQARDDLEGSAWAAAFAAGAIGAALGAHAHGFPDFVSPRTHRLVWRGTLFFVGMAGLLFALAALLAMGVRPAVAAPVIGAAAAVYVVAIARSPSFTTAGIAYAAALLALTVRAFMGGVRPPGPGAWILAAVTLTALGVIAQRAKLGLHERFNHNDVYHVIQLVALFFLYRAALG